MNATDGDLLRRFIRDRSEAAFEELVRRHLGLVYSAALRQVNQDTHLAQDVTQVVFADLARKAPRLARHGSIAGWLYTSTRFAASTVRRSELRRLNREKEAHAMQEKHSDEPQADWNQISPLLDEAMHALPDEDREAVLMRHFEQQTFGEIGSRLGISENAARMRIERALEKLQSALAKRGITSTASALGVLLAVNSASSAPLSVVPAIVRGSLAAGGGGTVAALSSFFASSLVKSAAVVLVCTIGLSVFMAVRPNRNTISKEVAVGSVFEETNSIAPISNAAVAQEPSGTSPGLSRLVVPQLRLQVVSADSGLPIPLVNVHYTAVEGRGGSSVGATRTGRTDRRGAFELLHESSPAGWNIALELEDFADTWVQLRRGTNDLPTNIVVRLDRAVPIGGIVLDPDGNPAAGAKVVFSTSWNPSSLKVAASSEHSQFHHLYSEANITFAGWGEVSATTDEEGRWRLARIAADLLPRCNVRATHPEHVASGLISLAGKERSQDELRKLNYILKLSPGTTFQDKWWIPSEILFRELNFWLASAMTPTPDVARRMPMASSTFPDAFVDASTSRQKRKASHPPSSWWIWTRMRPTTGSSSTPAELW